MLAALRRDGHFLRLWNLRTLPILVQFVSLLQRYQFAAPAFFQHSEDLACRDAMEPERKSCGIAQLQATLKGTQEHVLGAVQSLLSRQPAEHGQPYCLRVIALKD